MMAIFLKGFFVWLLIAGMETIHGIVRAKFLAPRVGDFRSRQIGVFTGSFLILGISLLTFHIFSFQRVYQALAVGFQWFVLMFVFEFLLGRFVFGFSWNWLFQEYAFWKGKLLLFGMFFLFLAPYLSGLLLGQW
jgi:hypothetical protein